MNHEMPRWLAGVIAKRKYGRPLIAPYDVSYAHGCATLPAPPAAAFTAASEVGSSFFTLGAAALVFIIGSVGIAGPATLSMRTVWPADDEDSTSVLPRVGLRMIDGRLYLAGSACDLFDVGSVQKPVTVVPSMVADSHCLIPCSSRSPSMPLMSI